VIDRLIFAATEYNQVCIKVSFMEVVK